MDASSADYSYVHWKYRLNVEQVTISNFTHETLKLASEQWKRILVSPWFKQANGLNTQLECTAYARIANTGIFLSL